MRRPTAHLCGELAVHRRRRRRTSRTVVRGVTAAAHVVPSRIEEQFYLLWPVVVFGLAESAQGTNNPADRRLCSRCCRLGRADGRTGRNRPFTGVLRDGRSSAHDPRRCASRPRSPPPPTGRRFSRSDRSCAWGRSLTLLGASFVVVSDSGAWFYQGGSMLVAVAVALVIADGVSGSPSLAECPSRLDATPWPRSDQLRPYLWHWPMIVWLTPERLGTDGLALGAIRVAATFGCALVSYVIVEQPIRHRSPHPLQRCVPVLLR